MQSLVPLGPEKMQLKVRLVPEFVTCTHRDFFASSSLLCCSSCSVNFLLSNLINNLNRKAFYFDFLFAGGSILVLWSVSVLNFYISPQETHQPQEEKSMHSLQLAFSLLCG
jgi:hypothetical protein